MKGRLLLDASAWHRLFLPSLPAERSAEIGAAMEEGRLLVSLPFLLEVGYSARDSRAHEDFRDSIERLPRAAIDEQVERRALDGQSQLARAGHHRLPPVDLLMAALADRHGLDVLHYDGHYDAIARLTDLRFESVWLAGAGTL